jgi:D-alanyl-D-alanine carboxypeptidase/D-alanyl-D-alanine-endopeptidase (penicillin-binding protein 4)
MRCALAAIAVWLVVLAPAAAGEKADLRSRLDAVLQSRGLKGARVGALVVTREDGRVVYQREPDRPLVPASNLKILTSVAALSVWGPTHRFVTEIFATSPLDPQGSIGALVVRGGGDPALTSEQLWRLAADLRLLGIRRVRDGLLLDASVFDAEHLHPGWGATSARAYHAPVAALSANYGAIAVVVEAGARAGDPVRVQLDPPIPYLRLNNRARTGGSSARANLVIDRQRAGDVEEVVVSGEVRAGSRPATYYRSVLDPVRYAGAVLRMQLEANGIVVEGEDRVGRVPDSAVPLLEFKGKNLAEVVELFLKYSNNAMGEALVKGLGAHGGGEGSWSSGLAAIRAELHRLGLTLDRLSMVDGSGLSGDNRVTPRTLVSALRSAEASFRFGPEFVAALPIAAADGTLRERVTGAAHQLRAKTGLLTHVRGVTSLAGYANSASGEPLVFTILVNDFPMGSAEAKAAVDRFAEELVKGEVPPKGPASAISGSR